MILTKEKFKRYIDKFNQDDEENVIQHVDNQSAWSWLESKIPYFECPNKAIEETYYFRWWTYRKHLKQTPDGYIITEFHPTVPWAGKHNSINCAAGHHLNEGRWLKDSKDFLYDYIQFWFRHGGNSRSYSVWLADAIWNYCTVVGDFSVMKDLLPDLIENYQAWETSNLHASGLFWSVDDRDAMEYSISGSGLRPTLNSYLYADALAIAKTARLMGQVDVSDQFNAKAATLKRLIMERLWDPEAKFFKVIPLQSVHDTVSTWDFREMNQDLNVREQIGYIPWYFNLPNLGYEVAWEQLVDDEGFQAPYGPTTAERRHSRFMFAHEEHECLWNGPSWPFSTSQTLTSMANLLNNYEQSSVNRHDYLSLLDTYARSHYRQSENGRTVSWIDENLDPFTGDWLSRRILAEWNWPENKGGRERGKDYNHSTYCDLVIHGLVGVRPQEGDTLVVNPLVPEDEWDYFCLDGLSYRDKTVSILYDKTGERYGRGSGLRVFLDGVEAAASATLEKIRVNLE